MPKEMEIQVGKIGKTLERTKSEKRLNLTINLPDRRLWVRRKGTLPFIDTRG